MRVTSVLLKQHIGRHFERHWWVQGKKKPIDTGAEKVLKQKNIPIYKPEDITRAQRVIEKINVVGYQDKPLAFDHTHPNWSEKILLTYKDNNVLVEGLAQAKVITKTVEPQQGLPTTLALTELSKPVNKRVKKIILGSHIFDAEQKKLPKVKDPERPAWNFPRSYGVTQNRVNKLIISKLLQLIETTSPAEIVKQRYLMNNLSFSVPFERCGNSVQFTLRGDSLITSIKPLSPPMSISTDNLELPDIYPLEPIISLNEENIYKIENIYPIDQSISKSHPHTLFIHFDRDETKNLFEEEVTDTQLHGRSLLKAFTVAASYARQQHGLDVKDLPKPVVVQCVQTDGKMFHFGVFQLNTLKLEEGTVKNVWFQTPIMTLFDKCSYQLGKPILEGYNMDVIKHLYTFYNNV